MKLKTCLIPVNGYDMEGLALWLEQMAKRKLQYVDTVGPFAQFRRAECETVRLHLEPVQKGTPQEEKTISEFYSDVGWTYWGSFKGVFYVFATQEENAVSHTQPEVLEYALRQQCRQLYLRCILAAAAFAGLLWWIGQEFAGFFGSFEFRYAPLYSLVTTGKPYWMLPLLPALFLLAVSMARGIGKVYRAIFLLHSGGTETETPRLRGGGWLKAAWLCLLLVPLFWGFQLRYEDSVSLEELNASAGYVRLEELETAAGFSVSDALARDRAVKSRQLLVPTQWYSQEWGGYNVTTRSETLENGVTVVTHSPQQYYLTTRLLRCRTAGIAGVIFRAQDHWSYFQSGTTLSYPGFDELIVNLERGDETVNVTGELSLSIGGAEIPVDLTVRDMNRWNLYGRAGKTVLFVEYRGSGDLREFLPRFAEMVRTLG